MKKHILIPTDFSSHAFNAIKYAFELFKSEECTFHIFHSYYIVASTKGNPMFPVPEEVEYRSARQSVRREMEALRQKMETLPKNDNHRLQFDFDYGFLVDLIREKVEREKIDLVVMGTRGATDDRKVAYGRNAVDVMENMRGCAVLAIPAKVKFPPKGEIVYPTDFKGNANEEEMQTFKNIARLANAPISILHIGSEKNLDARQQENKKRLEAYFGSWEHSFHWLQDVALLEGLLYFVKERGSTMICFVNRKHWFFGNIFSRPLIKNLGVDSTVPILALHSR